MCWRINGQRGLFLSHCESQDTEKNRFVFNAQLTIARSGLFLFHCCLCFSFPWASSNRQADRQLPDIFFLLARSKIGQRTLPPVIKCFLTMLVPDACQSSSQLLSTSTLSHMRRRQSSSTCLYKVLLTRSTKFTIDKPVLFYSQRLFSVTIVKYQLKKSMFTWKFQKENVH